MKERRHKMDYQEYYKIAKETKKRMEEKVSQAEKALKEFNSYGKSDMGLTPDFVKNKEEYKIAKQNFENVFNDLRNFNSNFVKVFKKEIRDERSLTKTISYVKNT
jgi:hypothetical protein